MKRLLNIIAVITFVILGLLSVSPHVAHAASTAATHGNIPHYEYTTSWGLGNWGSQADVTAMDILTDNPNGAFPFYVEGENNNSHIVLGGNYCLHTNVILPIGCDHVTVVQENTTSFTFEGGPGHIEGEGSLITFSTSIDANGNLILSQHAVGPDAFGPLGGFKFLNGKRWEKAQQIWSTQARNLLGELQATGGQDTYSW